MPDDLNAAGVQMLLKTLLAVILIVPIDGSLIVSTATAQSDNKADSQPGLYHPDPHHLWNRLHAALWDRTGPDGVVYGHDRIDPLLWSQTRYLRTGPSREAALRLLNEFLDTEGETLIDDPLKRAVLQRDIWAIFDWLVSRHENQGADPVAHESLRLPLAHVIGRLALSPQLIESLPDTYALAVAAQQTAEKSNASKTQGPRLPPDLFDPQGPWVCVGRNGSDIIAPAHTRGFSRSTFQVFLKLPGGRKATSNYLSGLSSFKEPFQSAPQASDGRLLRQPNSELPPFPAGTQVALVRCAMLIDSELRLRPTRIVESVQLRDDVGNPEYTFSRALLFASKSDGLRAVAATERDFSTNFNATERDVFESDANATGNEFTRRMPIVLNSCASCHRHGATVQSFNTFIGGFSPHVPRPSLFDTRTTSRGETAAIRNKQTRYDWGLLEGLLVNSRQSEGP